ncbi:MAG: 2,3-diaminopropionate biosynthesis protein SbnA [Acidobacteria bacterium]|nr:2,3-diaminopropionate biosynthesis protein SbnA [Acidobacteriota bacterium]
MQSTGILSAIGDTPLIRLGSSCSALPFNVFAKLESLNPGGSTKDRPAFHIIRQALDTGALKPGSVVIESSSGNMGIGLAQACTYYGLRFVCVVDAKTTAANVRLLKAYGAEVHIVTEPDPETGEYLPARIRAVGDLLASTPNGFWADQYSNEANAAAHRQTMREIATALGGEVDYLFCATSTCGTLRGCSEYVREHGLRTKVIGVDAVGSVIFGGTKGTRLLPGHGAAVRPKLFKDDLADMCVHVTDLDCVTGCRRLARHEAILAGGSSGGVFTAVERLKDEIPAGANCVLIFPDRGERYLDTVYSDEWVSAHFGEVSHLWEGDPEGQSALAPAC